jgi:POTRA domain, FtsQ-type
VKAGARPGPRALPRRRKPSIAARIRPFWIVAALLGALLAWGGVWLAQAPWFRIERVTINVPIGSPVSRDDVRAAARVATGANVWLLNPWGIRRRINAIPYVATATMRRGQLPQPFVDLTITVRRPSACVSGNGRVVTIDDTARVLQMGCATRNAVHIDAGRATIPAPGSTIGDQEIAHLLADVKILAGANLELRSLGRDRWGGLQAVDVSGVMLRFGEDDDLAKKAALVAPVRAGIGGKRPILAIDLRAPETPTVEFR